MGQGLSKNSPVQLELGKENYEALIERHGQWVRWRVASKCPCIKANTQQPDIHCKKCGGLGVLYGYQKQATVSQTVMVCNGSGIIELDGAFDCLLTRCYDNAGNIYENAKKTGTFVMLNAEKLPSKGVYVTAIMTATVLKTVEHTQAESIGNATVVEHCPKHEISCTVNTFLFINPPQQIYFYLLNFSISSSAISINCCFSSGFNL